MDPPFSAIKICRKLRGFGFACAGALGNSRRTARGTPYVDDDRQGDNSFHSRHPSGVHFARCDNSRQWVSNSAGLALFRAQCTIANNEAVSLLE